MASKFLLGGGNMHNIVCPTFRCYVEHKPIGKSKMLSAATSSTVLIFQPNCAEGLHFSAFHLLQIFGSYDPGKSAAMIAERYNYTDIRGL